MGTELVISFEVEGKHYWPEAPELYKEFETPHSHIFKVICFFNTKESDDPTRRELELFALRRQCLQLVTNHYNGMFGGMSCEGIADSIKQLVEASRVFVGEDQWFGALVS